jgi:exosortase J
MAENMELALPAPRTRVLLGCGIAVLTAIGCLGIWRELFYLWVIWTGDPLRSIGMLIPPASIVLTLLVWRQLGWEMRGTWWGLPIIALAFFLSVLRQKLLVFAVFGGSALSFIPGPLPVYVYGCGVVLLFAGTRVWRKAWFPIGLLLLSQPVPGFINGLVDIPLQSISAQVARSFATLIHFAPTTPQLRLMFSPDFGMFIAPGCDGIRGSVTMGYVALISGYVKRVAWYLWLACVAGAVLLGYLFNFVRLCVLVIYYRLALGHPLLEGAAKWADYVIGSCLFLVAMLLFLYLVRRQPTAPASVEETPEEKSRETLFGGILARGAAFVALIAIALALPSSTLRAGQFARTGTPESYAASMPKQIGNFVLTRTWYEQMSGTLVEENGAYSSPGSDEIILGVWVAPLSYYHNRNVCWLARGLHPDMLTDRQFQTAKGEPIALNTGFYNDGVTDTIVVSLSCTPETCSHYQSTSNDGVGVVFLQPEMRDLAGTSQHPVSIMVRIDKLESDGPKAENYNRLAAEAQQFIVNLDPVGLSRTFQ